ncbi:hypothetical protein CEE36_08680 [candidate division TA06 bacterium B3_TA06]|uniref:F5/8 type C domain-containing protein n=1 Tax=candidate division TA06 bacterium B3_TA06 TaxID=2012487 RepID=A0A532V1D8_UNCT6|nr:MAG: hypothetical protein CEE36_08680 [candidate division TA06 bacterium B3_TA06]
MPICKECGTKNDEGSVFCEECGAKLVPEERMQASVEELPPKRKKSKLGLIIGISLGCLVLVAIALLLIFNPWGKSAKITFSSSMPPYEGHKEIYAVDSDPSTYYWSNAYRYPDSDPEKDYKTKRGWPTVGDYFQVDLGKIRKINRVKIIQAPDGDQQDYLRHGKLQYSKDGEKWTTIGTVSNRVIDESFGPVKVRCVRLLVTQLNDYWVKIAEFQVF